MLICRQLPGASPPGTPTRALPLTRWEHQRSPDPSPTYHLMPSYATDHQLKKSNVSFNVITNFLKLIFLFNDFLGLTEIAYLSIYFLIAYQ
jgi:hypothetical protein